MRTPGINLLEIAAVEGVVEQARRWGRLERFTEEQTDDVRPDADILVRAHRMRRVATPVIAADDLSPEHFDIPALRRDQIWHGEGNVVPAGECERSLALRDGDGFLGRGHNVRYSGSHGVPPVPWHLALVILSDASPRLQHTLRTARPCVTHQ